MVDDGGRDAGDAADAGASPPPSAPPSEAPSAFDAPLKDTVTDAAARRRELLERQRQARESGGASTAAPSAAVIPSPTTPVSTTTTPLPSSSLLPQSDSSAISTTSAPGSPASSSTTRASSLRDDLVSTAVKFLLNPRVRESTLERKRSFLKEKGLTEDEIAAAMEQADAATAADPPAPSNATLASPGAAALPKASNVASALPTPPMHNTAAVMSSPPAPSGAPVVPPEAAPATPTWRSAAASLLLAAAATAAAYRYVAAPLLHDLRLHVAAASDAMRGKASAASDTCASARALADTSLAHEAALRDGDLSGKLSALTSGALRLADAVAAEAEADLRLGVALSNVAGHHQGNSGYQTTWAIREEAKAIKGLLLKSSNFPTPPRMQQAQKPMFQ